MINLISHDLAKVPVIVMIAMTPSMLNAKTPEQYMPLDINNATELYSPLIAQNDATYVALKPQEPQQVEPFYYESLRYGKIHCVKPATVGSTKTNVVLYGNDKNNDTVRKVYLISDGEKDKYESHIPAEVRELIYHDLGPDKEYLGVMILKPVYNKNTHKLAGVLKREQKIDDDAAQFLLDLYAGETKWKNNTGIKFKETKNPKTAPVEML